MGHEASGDGGEAGLQLLDLIDLPSLQRLQDSFAAATGVASIITLPDGSPLTTPSRFSRLCNDVIRKTELGLRNCMRSDAALGRPNPAGPIMRPCLSCGLWDAGASIFAGEQHVANWLIGQVRNQDLSEDRILEYAREIGADEATFQEAFAEVTVMPTEQFRAVCEFLFRVANQISSIAYEKVVQRQQSEERRRLEEQLEQSRKLQSIGQLAGGVAHDFNNLLTTILGNVDLLLLDAEQGELDARRLLDDLAEIQAAGERAADLTRQLLAFSRQQVGNPVGLDLNEVVRRFEPILRSLIPESARVELALEDRALGCWADPSQVEQVLLNLVVNARDAVRQGGVVRIETGRAMLDAKHLARHPDARIGSHVWLSVSDTGIGMSREVVERIFEPFFTTKQLGEGTGLGLATVHGLVHQAEGHVTVESELGAGSRFRVYWPELATSPRALSGPPIVTSLFGSETILVCEDSREVRSIAARFLRSAGYSLLEAGGGEQALAILAEARPPPDLLLTDVVMPGMHGKALAEAARAQLPGLKVLFMSGYTAEVIAHHGILEEGLRLVEKPFSRTSLLTAVRRALDERAPNP